MSTLKQVEVLALLYKRPHTRVEIVLNLHSIDKTITLERVTRILHALEAIGITSHSTNGYEMWYLK